MKTIEQLLQLKENPYYQFTDEEQAMLDDFLSKQSARQRQQKDSSSSLSLKTPAIVHSKNIFAKETGEMPVEEAS